MEASYSLDQTRRSGYDPDELEEEQRERAMRARMNQEFQNFVKKVEEQAAHLESNLYFTQARTLTLPPTPTPTLYPMTLTLTLTSHPPPPPEQAKDLEFDIPYRDLGFYGVPNK
eukprot:scaffold49809_cov34-Phaeocystis_antarctica.AAC.1